MNTNYEPKKKNKNSVKQFLSKYIYVIALALVLILGTSYSLMFFIQNRKIDDGSISVGGLTVNLSNNAINATNLTASNDSDGIGLFTKSLTINNTSTNNGNVKVSITRTSGLELTDLRYGLFINDVLMEISDVPLNGLIYESAIIANETINVELRLWPKSTYSGNVTTFVGTLDSDITYGGLLATEYIALLSTNDNKITKTGDDYTYASDSTNNYVKFNCDSGTCETWRIVGVKNDRLVLTSNDNYSGASSRTYSKIYDATLTYNDDTDLVFSHSTDKNNVYLIKTAKIIEGSGTTTNPYELGYDLLSTDDNKAIATLTYNNSGTTTTQPIYYGRTNYISQPIINDTAFIEWTDNTNTYQLGDIVSFTSNTTLYARKNLTLQIANLSATDNDIKEFATTNLTVQDTLTPNANQRDVYYYTDGENSNVLFNNTCWQIVRTTDTGGVKLLYNGLPDQKQVFATNTALDNDDITIVTNTASYPYTYSDGKWTSGAVPDNGTGTFEFKVNTQGYYTINYDISTQTGNDVMHIYKDNVELRLASGVVTSGLRLGNLTTNNVIKITYAKNADTVSGRDNIIFEITKGEGTSETITSCDDKRMPITSLKGVYTSLNLNDDDYYYADSYTYTSSGFTLSADATLARWSDATYTGLIGKYVCENKGTSCPSIHYVQSYNSNRAAGTSKYTIGLTRSYNEIGTSDFNEHYTSLSSVGYMYNTNYEYKTKVATMETILPTYNVTLSHMYSSDVSWNSTSNRYELSNPDSIANAAAAKDKYTFGGSGTYGGTVRYIVGMSGNTAYYFNLTNAGTHDLTYFDSAYTYGTSISEENGQYRINNATTIHKTDWFTSYSTVNGKYVCPGSSSLCNKEDLRYVTNTTATYMYYYLVETSYRFGSDVSYSNGVYTLTGTTQDVKDWPNSFTANNNILQNMHYTCLNEEGSNECGSKVYYVFWTDKANIRYIELENGKKYDDALYEMINYKGSDTSKADANINKYDSAIKQMIDHWYVNSGLVNKTSYLEDAVYCNDRTILNNDLRNWDPSKTTKETWTLYFKMASTNVNTNTLTCENVTDRFLVGNSKAKLTYPVGLLTEQERALMMNKSGGTYAGTGLYLWLASPSGVRYSDALERSVASSGAAYSYSVVGYAYGVRPAVSLGPDTVYTFGNGSYDNPIIID